MIKKKSKYSKTILIWILISASIIIIPKSGSAQLEIGFFNKSSIDIHSFETQFTSDIYGIKTIIPVYKNWSINLSTGYSNPNYYFSLSSLNASIYGIQSYAHQIRINPHIQYYFVKGEHLSLYGLIGQDFNINLFQKVYFPDDSEMSTSWSYLYNTSVIAGFGFKYLRKRWGFALEPSYSYKIWSDKYDGAECPFNSSLGFTFAVLYSPACDNK